ncbi:MAG TPA: HIT domain-containing protein [Pseudonocardiaceae bacterium]|nr:HIT domain-containing protein [Pseudonocardiaceae bacterium]
MTQPVLCEGADLCQEIARSADNSFVRTYQGNPPSRLIFETDSFALIADMSPLVVGHLLLLPKIHYMSFSALIPDHLHELERFMSGLVPYYSATFGEPLVLEHGSASESDSNACVTHAHWHLVPVDGAEVDALIRLDDLTCAELTGMAELGGPSWRNRPYYYTSYAGEHHVYEPSPASKRQYLRSVLGRVLSIDEPEWDYALVVRKDYLRETMNRVRLWFP